MPRKATPRDPNLDHQAVKLYRDICHSTPNHVQRVAIVAQVTDLALYEAVLTKFMSEGVAETTPEEEEWMRSRLRLK